MKNVDMFKRKEQKRTEQENNPVSIGNVFSALTLGIWTVGSGLCDD